MKTLAIIQASKQSQNRSSTDRARVAKSSEVFCFLDVPCNSLSTARDVDRFETGLRSALLIRVSFVCNTLHAVTDAQAR